MVLPMTLNSYLTHQWNEKHAEYEVSSRRPLPPYGREALHRLSHRDSWSQWAGCASDCSTINIWIYTGEHAWERATSAQATRIAIAIPPERDPYDFDVSPLASIAEVEPLIIGNEDGNKQLIHSIAMQWLQSGSLVVYAIMTGSGFMKFSSEIENEQF